LTRLDPKEPKMPNLVRLAVAVIALLNLVLGLLFLVRPEGMAAQFHLTPIGSQGLASIRADFTAFFLVAGGFALLGAQRMDPEPLHVPVALFAIAFLGRSVSLLFDGIGPAAFPPMIAEAVMIAVLLAAMRQFREHRR
jgi:hypothetical protein